MGSNYYGGVIWTNHALSRMKERGLTHDLALDAFNHPDSSQKAGGGTIEYRKRFDHKLVTIIAKQNDKSEWIIISAWVDPPLVGSEDDKKRKAFKSYQKAPVWKKTLIVILQQLGLRKY